MLDKTGIAKRIAKEVQDGFYHLGEPNSYAYQSAVRKFLKTVKPADYQYFFESFIQEGLDLYMMTNFKNEKSCFSVKILMSKGDNLAGKKRVDGWSFPNKLLKLAWRVVNVNGREEVVYVDKQEVVD